MTTGPDGTYLLENMEEDWYEVYELRSPTGYVTDDTHYDIELIAGETAELVVKNRKKPTFTIEKIDSVTLQPLEGVVFEISVKNGKSLGQFTTDAEGKSSWRTWSRVRSIWPRRYGPCRATCWTRRSMS